MNEELKIIINAITKDAQKNIAKVTKELEGIKGESNEAGKSVDEAMAAISKGALIAVGAITALTGAMVALSKSSDEFTKAQARVTTGFQSLGSNAEQASKTFQNLFRFMGESDTAAEAANLLAQITTNEQDLTEWTTILQGVYARFPDSIPVESLAEAANETAKVGKVTGTLADALNWVGVSEDAFNAQLATTNSYSEREALIRNTLIGLYGGSAVLYERNNQAMIRLNDSQYRLNVALSQATAYVLPLRAEFNNLAATALAVLQPAFEELSAMLIVFVRWVITAIQYVGAFFGIFSDTGASAIASVGNNLSYVSSGVYDVSSGLDDMSSGFNKAASAAAKLRKETMGFDELNVVSSQTSASTGSLGGVGGGSGVKTPKVSIPSVSGAGFNLPSFSNFTADLKEAEGKLKAILTLVSLIGAAYGVWKIAGVVTDLINCKKAVAMINNITSKYGEEAFEKAFGKSAKARLSDVEGKYNGIIAKLKTFGGFVLMAAGAMLLLWGYTDAWANGVDWGNLALMIGGAALAVTGLYLAFGQLAMSIGIVVAGIALIIIGVVDFIKNGPTLQNTILIIGGAIAIAVGLATAGLSVLLSAIIAVVAAVAAFTAAIILEEKAILSVEEAEKKLMEAKEAARQAEEALTNARLAQINALEAAEQAQQRLIEAEKAAGISGADLQEQVDNGTLAVEDMTDAQREVYKAYLDNEKKQADLAAAQEKTKGATDELTAAKKQETLASFDNRLALAKEKGSYDEYKKAVVDAFNKGELSAEEARDAIGKSMSEMSRDSQKTFMEDLPKDIKDGLDPKEYETTGQKLKKWFNGLWSNIFSKKSVSVDVNGTTHTADVPKMATGGIVTGSVIANIGEAGREAVLPLESNTGWMDTLADRIANKNGAPTKVVLKVGEKELGEAAISSINGITHQTGSLQLKLV
jgi:hypothetical protein